MKGPDAPRGPLLRAIATGLLRPLGAFADPTLHLLLIAPPLVAALAALFRALAPE